MAGSADLFVVCKKCGSEVSPYVTECPYCGNRLRKRAPKLERGAPPEPSRSRRSVPRPSLGRLRSGEIPGIRVEGRPWATALLVLAAALVSLGWQAALYDAAGLVLIDAEALGEEPWRVLTAPFLYFGTTYEFLALGAIAVFGWLLERRHGPAVPPIVFLLCAGFGMAAAALAGEVGASAVGGNAGALGLLAAWAVPDLIARRRRQETESDGLGALIFAAVLLLLPAFEPEAGAVAGVVGAALGLLCGLALSRRRART